MEALCLQAGPGQEAYFGEQAHENPFKFLTNKIQPTGYGYRFRCSNVTKNADAQQRLKAQNITNAVHVNGENTARYIENPAICPLLI